MSSYIGRHAELYDIFYSEKNYSEEVEFIDKGLKKHGINPSCKILELACGSGNHAFFLEKKGYTITGIDYSEDMIREAKLKASKSSSGITFSVGDMRELPLFSAKFDAALCLFDSIGYPITNEGICRTLQGISRNLIQGGLLVFEFWHAAAMLKHYEPVRVKKFYFDDKEIVRISETTIDYENQSCSVKYTINELKKDGTFSTITEVQKNRFFLMQEINLFLEVNGFEIIKNFSGYTDNTLINDQSWHIVSLARKL